MRSRQSGIMSSMGDNNIGRKILAAVFPQYAMQADTATAKRHAQNGMCTRSHAAPKHPDGDPQKIRAPDGDGLLRLLKYEPGMDDAKSDWLAGLTMLYST